MNQEKLNSTLTLVANAAILVGLFLVIVELRQNDETLAASIELSLSESYEELATIGLENPHFSDSLYRIFVEPENLTPQDQMMIMSWQYRYMVVLHATFQLRNRGGVSDEMWREKASHFTVYLQYPSMYQLYKGSLHDEFFSADFYAELQSILDEQLAADKAESR